MALAPADFLLKKMSELIQQEGNHHTFANKFAHMVRKDPILSIRINELRHRSRSAPTHRRKKRFHAPPPPTSPKEDGTQVEFQYQEPPTPVTTVEQTEEEQPDDQTAVEPRRSKRLRS